jgi:penicillin-binding protein 2
MGYGPYEDPEIAIALLVEHGGSSSRVAVPLARDFFAGFWGVVDGVRTPDAPADLLAQGRP